MWLYCYQQPIIWGWTEYLFWQSIRFHEHAKQMCETTKNWLLRPRSKHIMLASSTIIHPFVWLWILGHILLKKSDSTPSTYVVFATFLEGQCCPCWCFGTCRHPEHPFFFQLASTFMACSYAEWTMALYPRISCIENSLWEENYVGVLISISRCL